MNCMNLFGFSKACCHTIVEFCASVSVYVCQEKENIFSEITLA